MEFVDSATRLLDLFVSHDYQPHTVRRRGGQTPTCPSVALIFDAMATS
jgi:hypothetical protein